MIELAHKVPPEVEALRAALRDLGTAKKQLSATMEDIGFSLRVRRTKARISLRTMAAKLKISPPFLSDLELGHRPWTEARIQSFISHLS